MLMIGLMVFGLLSFKGMGVGQMPDVDFPVLNISVTWEGAAPEVMETDVVDIVEDAVTGVEGVREISSSTRQGQSAITIEFELERDIDVALQEVQSKMAEVQQRLPRDIDPPVIQKINPEDQPIMWLAVSSTRPLPELMNYVDTQLKDKFKMVKGVGEIFLGGYIDPSLRVWIDSKKLDQYELTVSDVANAIRKEHVEMPAGRLETNEKESNIRAMGEARTIEDFEKIMISQRAGSPIYRPIQLKEVARIENGLADVRRISRVNGQPAVGLGIRKQRGTNTVEVAHGVKEKLKKIEKDIPEGYTLGINFDSTQFIEESVDELVFTLILSAILTSLVCWLFLGSWSSTLNILFAIPTSILGTFIVLKFAGFTLNTFTLLGLSLSIGIVVDDAIMVLENIVRHREKGENQMEAALKGSKEIGFAALAATLAIIAIFLPVAYMQGVIGKFFFQFGVTISTAVALSLLEALTLAPMRCSQFLETGERKTRIGKFYERAMTRLENFYSRTLNTVISHKKKTLIFSFIFFIASLFCVPFIKKEFVPLQDQSMFLARIQTPIGSSIEFTSQKMREVEELVMKKPEVRRYYAAVGGFTGGEINTGMLFVSLKKPGERPVDSKLRRRMSQEDIMNYFRAEFNKVPNVQAFIQDLSLRGFTAQRGFPIEFSIRGPEWDKLAECSRKIQDEMKKNNFFADVDTDYLEGMPEVRIYPDRDKAFARGVSVSEIAQTINTMLGGEKVGKYTQGGKRYDVRVKAEPGQSSKIDDIKSLYVWNNRGERVLLSDVVTMSEQPSLLAITRKGRERAIGIFANVGTGHSQAVVIDKAKEIAARVLPDGYRAVFSGSSETFKESFQTLIFALVLGILVSYMVLAAQFNHIVHPVTVLLALPFSISGAFIAMMITGKSLNIFSFIGLLLLMGIVKKNSILLVEFTNQMRHKGLSPLEAIKTACPVRLRPIIMTSVATIAAAVPPALAMGPGAETRIPMAIAVIGGVTVSTVLTLYIVPCAYLWWQPLEEPGKLKGLALRLVNKAASGLSSAGKKFKQ